MEAFLRSWFPIALLLALLNSVSTQKTKYFTNGSSIELRPSHSGEITSVLWKHKGNLVADWSQNDLELFGKFKERTTLNEQNGTLVINRTTQEDQGIYTVRINLKTSAEESFDVKMVRQLYKPQVVLKPLTCSKRSTGCSLFCEEGNGADSIDTGPVSYTFIGDDIRFASQSTKHINISKHDTGKFKKLSCLMKNPINEQQSDVIENIFYQPDSSPTTKIVAAVLVVGVVVVAAVVGYVKRQSIISCITKKQDDTNRPPTSNSNGNTQAGTADENVPLEDGSKNDS